MIKFQLLSQFLKDFHFESPNVPELFFAQNNSQAKLEINVDVQIKGSENSIYMVDLLIGLHSKLEKDDKSVFMIKSNYSGLVQIETTENEEELRKTLVIDIPQLLFPSIRSLILQITHESGFPVVSMPQIDFAELYENKSTQNIDELIHKDVNIKNSHKKRTESFFES